jgi:hypothetical protein
VPGVPGVTGVTGVPAFWSKKQNIIIFELKK